VSIGFDLAEIARAVEGSPLISSVSVEAAASPPAIAGVVEVAGRFVSLRVELGPPFPTALPKISVVEPAKLGLLSHLDAEGEVCYSAREGLLLDWRRPGELVVECIRKAIALLDKAISGELLDDYLEEYEAHWRQPPAVERVASVVEPGERVEEIEVHESDQGMMVARSQADLSAYNNGESPRTTRRTGLFIPLDIPTAMVPVPPLDSLDSLRQAIWKGLNEPKARQLLALLKHRDKRTDHIVLQVTRPSAEPSLVGLRFTGIGSTHPLLHGGDASKVERFVFTRLDRHALLPGGGASAALQDVSMWVVGCGAVGSRVIDELVHAGVSDIQLIDPDILLAENTFRHLLGRSFWGKPKASSLARWVTANMPYSGVTAVSSRFDDWLSGASDEDLAVLDLIVFATGDETTDLWAHSQLRGRHGPPMLFSWLEPLGIGGHALLELPDLPGCLECLHTTVDGQLTGNRAAFAAPEQDFVRDLTGCGSPFTPFSNLHATRTAVLTTALALDFLTGRVERPLLRSWRGDPQEFQAAGLRVSDRYSAFVGEDEERFAVCACPVCGAAGHA
jgi:molybdopterin-synthase adenylyltransferase